MRFFVFCVFFICACKQTDSTELKIQEIEKKYPDIVSHVVDLENSSLAFYLKDENGDNFKNFENLKTWHKGINQTLIFATNGGMYHKDLSPQGLYIEEGKTIKEIDLIEKGYGNFYLQPNGVFSISKTKEAQITSSKNFKNDTSVNYATQSGPMLVIDGALHPKFTEGSKNIHIRNGVGILPNGDLLFAMSKEKINFFDFASFFKNNGCDNALYLDGFVSRTYLPSKDWIQTDGNFGVIIGEFE